MEFFKQGEIKFLQYNSATIAVNTARSIVVEPYCNAWVAHNQGDVWAYVNDKLLKGFPVGHPELDGGAWGDNGNFGEVFAGKQINIRFDPSKAAGSSIQLVFVILKYYVFP